MKLVCVCVLTLSDPDSEDTEEDEECCWGLGMDMGESALCGDTESLCCSSDPTTQGSCSDTSGFRGETTKETRSAKFTKPFQYCLKKLHLHSERKVYLCCQFCPPTS